MVWKEHGISSGHYIKYSYSSNTTLPSFASFLSILSNIRRIVVLSMNDQYMS